MKRLFYALISLAVFAVTISAVYAQTGERIWTTMLRWGEIVIVFSLLAGVFRLIKSESLKAGSKGDDRPYSFVILISFILTFTAGLLNFESNRAVMNNSIREHPEFLFETVKVMIDEDGYLGKYPAKNRLVLYISGKVSNNFVPTDEMLKSADMSMDEFSDLRSGNTRLMMNEDDDFRVELLVEKVGRTALSTVRIMLPAAREMKAWFDHSVSSMPETPLSPYVIRKSPVNDLVMGDSSVEGSGEMLKNAVAGYLEKNGMHQMEKGVILVNYRDFVIFSGIGQAVVSQFASSMDESLPKNIAEKVMFSFLKTETVSSPKIKGVLQWIYRRVFDPLLSSFAALFLLSMISAAYRRFTLKSYSIGVVTVSAFITLACFAPVFSSRITGPVPEDFMMNVISMPVFAAMLIATGTGVIFFYFDRLIRMFRTGGGE